MGVLAGFWNRPTLEPFGEAKIPILGRKYEDSGLFIAEGNRIVIAFPGTDFFQPQDISAKLEMRAISFESYRKPDFNTTRLRSGFCCEDFLRLYASLSGEVREFIHQTKLAPEALQITLTGHGLGGIFAQLASVDLAGHFNYMNNQNNNLTVVTFGSPPVFTAVAQRMWNANWGQHNHLRIVDTRDPFPNFYTDLVIETPVMD